MLGFSAGGPYAAACGVLIPERLTCIGLVSCPPPMNEIALKKAPSILRINYYLSMYFPRLWLWSFKLYWLYAKRNPEKFIQTAINQSSHVDKVELSNPDTYSVLLNCWKENLRVDSIGYVYDANLLFKPWGFKFEDVSPKVYLWHGLDDNNTPPTWGKLISERIPDCEAEFLINQGHFLIFPKWKAILETLISAN